MFLLHVEILYFYIFILLNILMIYEAINVGWEYEYIYELNTIGFITMTIAINILEVI